MAYLGIGEIYKICLMAIEKGVLNKLWCEKPNKFLLLVILKFNKQTYGCLGKLVITTFHLMLFKYS